MIDQYTFLSLTRISDFQSKPFQIKKIEQSEWAHGDYTLVRITKPGGNGLKIELANGRMTEPMKGDLVIGAFGTRFATLEATGSWENIEADGKMHLLTGAGLLGKLTSKSFLVPEVTQAEYIGHIVREDVPVRMRDFVPAIIPQPFTKPVIMMVGTSMSAGKTTAARIITRQLKQAGLKVTGAKLSGAGRFRDILAVKDAGADYIFDFVDVGLPSSICPKEVFLSALKKLLTMIENTDTDFAVIEIGASPLEPYNGDIAIEEIKDNLKCIILCASDPYAVYGVMKSFELKPSIVSGVATNTLAGIALIEKLCGVPAINIIDPETQPQMLKILSEKTGIAFS